MAEHTIIVNPCKWYLDIDITRFFKEQRQLETLILKRLKVLKFKLETTHPDFTTFRKILEKQLVFVPELE